MVDFDGLLFAKLVALPRLSQERVICIIVCSSVNISSDQRAKVGVLRDKIYVYYLPPPERDIEETSEQEQF